MSIRKLLFETQDIIITKDVSDTYRVEIINNGCDNTIYEFDSLLNCLRLYVGLVMRENTMCREEKALMGYDIGVLLYVVKHYISDDRWNKIENSRFKLEFKIFKNGTKIVMTSKKYHITINIDKTGNSIKRSELGDYIGCYYSESFACKSLIRVCNLENEMLEKGVIDNSRRLNSISEG